MYLGAMIAECVLLISYNTLFVGLSAGEGTKGDNFQSRHCVKEKGY